MAFVAGVASGKMRARDAAISAISSPLLEVRNRLNVTPLAPSGPPLDPLCACSLLLGILDVHNVGN
eukprot:4544353-Pyramimonas_sp.AAC.1